MSIDMPPLKPDQVEYLRDLHERSQVPVVEIKNTIKNTELEKLYRAMSDIVSVCYQQGSAAARLNRVWSIAEKSLQKDEEPDTATPEQPAARD